MSVGERIDPGATVTRKFDSGKYYEPKRPAKYTAYVEILDRSGETLRTKAVKIEMQAPSQ
jgi:hypothetical protein